MLIQDTFDTPPPSDFASEPIHHFYFFETGVLIVLIIAGLWILSAIYGNANFAAARRPQDAVKKRVDRVVDKMAAAARANQTNQVKLAEDVKAAVDKEFSATLKLSEALNKAIGPLNKALEGTKEEDAPIRALTGPSTVTGGTVINIAVSGNDSVAAGPVSAMPAPVPGAPAAQPEPMSEDERRAALWTAVQRLFNAWKNKTAIVAAFHSAQAQLTASPLWEPPREEELLRDPHKRLLP